MSNLPAGGNKIFGVAVKNLEGEWVFPLSFSVTSCISDLSVFLLLFFGGGGISFALPYINHFLKVLEKPQLPISQPCFASLSKKQPLRHFDILKVGNRCFWLEYTASSDHSCQV